MSSFYVIHSSKDLWNRGQGSGCPRGLPLTLRSWLLLSAARQLAQTHTRACTHISMHAFIHAQTHTGSLRLSLRGRVWSAQRTAIHQSTTGLVYTWKTDIKKINLRAAFLKNIQQSLRRVKYRAEISNWLITFAIFFLFLFTENCCWILFWLIYHNSLLLNFLHHKKCSANSNTVI